MPRGGSTEMVEVGAKLARKSMVVELLRRISSIFEAHGDEAVRVQKAAGMRKLTRYF